ncbi:MAG: hypothetical protein J7L38_00475 [Thermoproteales archaeon]|nr:hypothetical protein [Thermoproteales archaeon]
MMEYAGGAYRRRFHCTRDYTGLEVMRVIRDEAINVGIPVLEFSPALGYRVGAKLRDVDILQYHPTGAA